MLEQIGPIGLVSGGAQITDPTEGSPVAVSKTPLTERLSFIGHLADPLDRLSLLGEVRTELDEAAAGVKKLTREAILELRSAGWTYARIGEVLGVSAQRVEQLARQ